MMHTVISAVANIWTAPDSPRPSDQFMLQPTVMIRDWLERMTYDERLGLCTDNVIQTQVLFGEKVLVTAEQGEWVSVIVPSQPSRKDPRGYPGWMKKYQLEKNKAHPYTTRCDDQQTCCLFVQKQWGKGDRIKLFDSSAPYCKRKRIF